MDARLVDLATAFGLINFPLTVLVWLRTEQILRKELELAHALAHVQVQEKLGAMLSNAKWLNSGGASSPEYRIDSLVQDSLSVLRMLRFAPPDLRRRYFEALEEVANSLAEQHGQFLASGVGDPLRVNTLPALTELAQQIHAWKGTEDRPLAEELSRHIGAIEVRLATLRRQIGGGQAV